MSSRIVLFVSLLLYCTRLYLFVEGMTVRDLFFEAEREPVEPGMALMSPGFRQFIIEKPSNISSGRR